MIFKHCDIYLRSRVIWKSFLAKPPEQCFFFSSRARAAHLSPFQRCHSLSKRLFKSCRNESAKKFLMIQWCGFPQDQQFLLACTFLEDNIINSWKEGMGGKTKTKKKGLAWHTNAFKREGPGKWMSEDAKRREAFFSPGGSERGDLLGRTEIFHTIYHRSSTFACLVTKNANLLTICISGMEISRAF